MENTLLNTIIEERLTDMPVMRTIKKHTRWIAAQTRVPMINSIFGTYLNPHCHVRDSYAHNFLKDISN